MLLRQWRPYGDREPDPISRDDAADILICTALAAFMRGRVLLGVDGPPDSKPRAEALQRKVQAVLRSPGYEQGHWGILVVDARTGRTVYEQNGDQLFAPASVTKLFSTAAALVEMGPDYRFETPVVRRGEIDAQGTLHGDLVLIAQGDPSMGGEPARGGPALQG